MKVLKMVVSDNYIAHCCDFWVLGYVGETNARVIEIQHPDVEGADTYRLRFEYSDGAIYDVPIIDGKVIVKASLLRVAGRVKCQWLATKAVGDTYDLVAKSQIFESYVGPSIGDDIAPIPTYEQALAILDKIQKEHTIEFANHYQFPNVGVSGKLYVAEDENTIYRWNSEKHTYTALNNISVDIIKAIL